MCDSNSILVSIYQQKQMTSLSTDRLCNIFWVWSVTWRRHCSVVSKIYYVRQRKHHGSCHLKRLITITTYFNLFLNVLKLSGLFNSFGYPQLWTTLQKQSNYFSYSVFSIIDNRQCSYMRSHFQRCHTHILNMKCGKNDVMLTSRNDWLIITRSVSSAVCILWSVCALYYQIPYTVTSFFAWFVLFSFLVVLKKV